MMMLEFIFLSITGLIIISLGLLIWKKEKIDLIHSYHFTKISPKNKKVYT